VIQIIYISLTRSRTVLLLSALILISGLVSYLSIARESSPNVAIPFVNIIIHHEGISPEDADSLLVGPVYKNIKSIEGLKEIKSVGTSGRAYLTLEFEQNININEAMVDVREQIDIAKTELPNDSEEPWAREYNIALQPIISLAISSDTVDERILFAITEKSKDQLEGITGVLEANIKGKREELVEVLIDPHALESHNINQNTLMNLVTRNNRLVTAGNLNTLHGRFAVKVPGLFENLEDILNLPVKQNDQQVITLKDIATVHRTFQEASSIVRLNGTPMISLDISKSIGSNIIRITDSIKAGVNATAEKWPKGLNILYLQDESKRIRNYLSDLENSVIFSTLLVMIIIIATLGVKNGLMVGLAIPGSFLIGILCLSLFDMTLNMVVLFSLILAVGMLVDASIVVIEYADRKLKEGATRRHAFAEAAIRMAWPIAASTATTLAVFAPLLFWPGVMGQFMAYLPLTLLFTLSASFIMAMILIPTLGSIGDKSTLTLSIKDILNTPLIETKQLTQLDSLSRSYREKLKLALHYPKTVLFICISILLFSFVAYSLWGKGSNFFPDSEPEFVSVLVKARGEMSLNEKDVIVKEVEEQVLNIAGIDNFYTTVFINPPNQASADTVGIIRLELSHWKERDSAASILSEIRSRIEGIAGVIVEVRENTGGPASGRDIELELSGSDYRELINSVDTALSIITKTAGLIDIQDSRPPPGFEWQLKVDRKKASQFGLDLTDIGNTIKLVTNGVILGNYRPNTSEDEVDIKLRYPSQHRSMDQIDALRITTGESLIPISSFVEQKASAKLSSINRTNGRLALTIEADVKKGYLANDIIAPLKLDLEKALPQSIQVNFKGKNEQQAESMTFLMKAFGVAVFAMAIILVTQFNSFYQAFLILTAIIFSINGVLFGLLMRGEPFSIVMSGVGIISLAGIVVNNNIVLIDTYNIMRQQGLTPFEAALQSGAQRFRPIILTTVTTILGLLPMVFEFNIKLLSQEIEIGAPSGQIWTQLSTAIAAGLTFATPLTLFLTPCMLILGDISKDNPNNTSDENKKLS